MNKLERLASAPATESSAEFLVQAYSGEGTTVDEFASSLPPHSRIIDVAAGRSNFGIEIAQRRDDIFWVNFDIQYDNPRILGPLLNTRDRLDVSNVHYLRGNAQNLPPHLERRFDRAYSYNYVFHLLRINRELGRQAIVKMLGLLNAEGELRVGPRPRPEPLSLDHSDSLVFYPNPRMSGNVIEASLHELSISRQLGLIYDATDASGVSIFPAHRFRPGVEGHLLFDHRDETYHQPLSLGGIRLAGRLAMGFIQRNKFESET